MSERKEQILPQRRRTNVKRTHHTHSSPLVSRAVQFKPPGYWQEDDERPELPVTSAGESEDRHSHRGEGGQCLEELNTHVTKPPSRLSSRYLPRWNKGRCSHEKLYVDIHCNFIPKWQKLEATQRSFQGDGTHEQHSARPKQTAGTCRHTGRSGVQCRRQAARMRGKDRMGPLHLVLEKAESQRCRQSRGEGLGGSAPGLGGGGRAPPSNCGHTALCVCQGS